MWQGDRPRPAGFGSRQADTEWSAEDDLSLQSYLVRIGFPCLPLTRLRSGVEGSRLPEYAPVAAYLESLDWDGVPRVGSWLATYAGAGPQARMPGAWWLVSAVARALEPGCKADCALVLEGRQGARKSSLLSVMAVKPAWFTDHIADFSKKDAREQLRGKWIVELGELSALKRGDVEAIKAFLSCREDHYRPSYARYAATFPRHCVFAGTTNADQYLSDTTGNRRWWPVAVGEIDIDGLTADRDQIWAEAVHLYRQGATWWPEASAGDALAEEAEARQQLDPWEPIVSRAVATLTRVTTLELLTNTLDHRPQDLTRSAQMRVGEILKSLGWLRQRETVQGRREWIWVRQG